MNNLRKEALAWRSKANNRTRRHLPGLLADPRRDGVEPENATPDEIRRLVPYLKSFPEQWEREGFDVDVVLPYSGYDDPVVLFVDGKPGHSGVCCGV